MNAIHCWGVITNSREKAEQVFDMVEAEDGLEVIRRVRGKQDMWTAFSDGHQLIWVRPTSGARGYRFHRAWVDKDIEDEDILNCAIRPKLYCQEEDVVWI